MKVRSFFWRLSRQFFAEELLRELYLGILGRDPDPEGIAAYIERPKGMGKPAAVIADLLRSEEFQQKSFALLAPDMARAFYRQVLGREADSEGLDSFTLKLTQKEDLDGVLAEFLGSDESRRRSIAALSPDLVNAIYKGLFERESDPEELANFSAKLAQEQDVATLLREALHSEEFQRKGLAFLAPELARAFYRGIMGRESDAKETATCTLELTQKENPGGVLAAMVGSDEFRRNFCQKYQTELPRATYDENAYVNGFLVKYQLYPWINFTGSADAVLSQFQEWNEKCSGAFIFRIDNTTVSIIDKHGPTTPHLLARARIYRSYFEGMSAFLDKQNILFALILEDGEINDPRCPVFSFQKDEGSKSILMPDVDFICSDFYTADKYLDLRPYESKANSAIFIGATTGAAITKAKILDKSVPRLKSAEYFKRTKNVHFELPTIVQCDSPETELMIRNLGYGSQTRDWSDQLKHKFLISMDGNGATCSRVVGALKSASVLLKYDSKSQLFYFPYLVPWKHYIPISSDEDVVNVVETEIERPGFFSSIARNGSDFANKHLTKEAVTRYTLGLLREYSQLMPSISNELMEKYGLTFSFGDGVPSIKETDFIRLTGHIQTIGDVPADNTGRAGQFKSGLALEGIWAFFHGKLERYNLEYRVGYMDGEYSQWCKSGEYAGTTGQNKAIISFEMKAHELFSSDYSCSYNATFTDGTSCEPLLFGATVKSINLSPLETIAINIAPRLAEGADSAGAAQGNDRAAQGNDSYLEMDGREAQNGDKDSCVQPGLS